jgi:hypothetical protein
LIKICKFARLHANNQNLDAPEIKREKVIQPEMKLATQPDELINLLPFAEKVAADAAILQVVAVQAVENLISSVMDLAARIQEASFSYEGDDFETLEDLSVDTQNFVLTYEALQNMILGCAALTGNVFTQLADLLLPDRKAAFLTAVTDIQDNLRARAAAPLARLVLTDASTGQPDFDFKVYNTDIEESCTIIEQVLSIAPKEKNPKGKGNLPKSKT